MGLSGKGGRVVQDKSLSSEAVRLYSEERLPISEIQKRVGRGYEVVRGWILDAGYEIESGYYRKTSEQITALRESVRRSNKARP